jgi:hypothetical protein
MATALSWVVASVLMFLEFGVLGCSALGSTRRSRFHLRLGCANLVMFALAVGLAFAITSSALPERMYGLGWVTLLVLAIAVPPLFCYQTSFPSHGSSDGEGGGGPGPGPPPHPPGPPPGGIPLADADQARTRRRDHNRGSLRGDRRRAPAALPGSRRSPVGPRRR